jgi:hypothetical protein
MSELLRNQGGDMGLTCSTHETDEKFIETIVRKPELERPLLEEPGEYLRIMLY